MQLNAYPMVSPLSGSIRVPGDKSVSHRSVILATLASGFSHIRGWLDAEDTQSTLKACEALGAIVSWSSDESGPVLCVKGCGGVLKQPEHPLDLGNSGTGVRLLMGAVAGQPINVSFTGDQSLSQRPMGRIVEPLQLMGATFEYADSARGVCLPLRSLAGQGDGLKAIDYAMPVASAQVQAAVLLAGLSADGASTIHQPNTCRDHSERMLKLFGAQINRQSAQTLIIEPSLLTGCDVNVPGDFSSAAFLIQAALLVPGSDVNLKSVGMNPTRTGLLQIVAAMGGDISVSEVAQQTEPYADMQIHAKPLHGLNVPTDLVANCIDEFPMIMAMASVAKGTTRIRGAAELRVKESDRIAVMAKALLQLGVDVVEYRDGVDIVGGAVNGGLVDADGDHRIAMSLAVLALVASGPVEISHAEAIATSYPNFVNDLQQLGAHLEWEI